MLIGADISKIIAFVLQSSSRDSVASKPSVDICIFKVAKHKLTFQKVAEVRLAVPEHNTRLSFYFFSFFFIWEGLPFEERKADGWR